MNTIFKGKPITGKYQGLFYRIDADGSCYEIFEITSITKNEYCVQGGYAEAGRYTTEYVEKECDRIIQDTKNIVRTDLEEFNI